jgi:hypothetical protein
VDWKLESQMVMADGGKQYDVLHVILKDGQKKAFYFDITQFYGKF